MSSQAIRNNITTSIRRVITDVKRKVIEEGKKKVTELKEELLSPDQIIRMLSADINHDSCSLKGQNKFIEKVLQIQSLLDEIGDVAKEGLIILNGLEEKIGGISSKIEIPPGPDVPPNPIEGIKKITEPLEKITKLLNYIVMAAPAILSASSGPAASGVVIATTNNNVNMAKAKISEYTNLFTSLPKLLDRYIAMADVIFDKITIIKDKIQEIIDQIDKLKAFIIYMEMDFLDKCNQLTFPTDPPIQEPPLVPLPVTLEDIIAQIEELYGNILEDLIARGDNKAIKRVYTLGVEFQRIKNTKIEVIDI